MSNYSNKPDDTALLTRQVAERQRSLRDEMIARGLIPNPKTQRTTERRNLDRYRTDPLAYAAERLKVAWWAKQQEIAAALLQNKRVLVKSANSIGKTFLAAGLLLWHYECFDPGITLTTAPTEAQVKGLLWREVRGQMPAGLPIKESDPLISNPDPAQAMHYAQGYTARDIDAFQGRHAEHLFIVFDEAVGVEQPFWTAANSMLTWPQNIWLSICNPTDTASAAYLAEQSGDWHVISVSALQHPNILAELAGEPPPIPGAASLAWVNANLLSWTSPVPHGDQRATDVEWYPGSGKWWRPGPEFESRVLGRWPSQATTAVWSDALLAAAFRLDLPPLEEPADTPCELGCDVARHGADFTTIHVRRGEVSLWHEAHNGWDTAQTAGRLKQLADEYGRRCGLDGRKIAVKVDDDGVGGGVVDQRGEHTFVPCSGAHRARAPRDYPNRRSESWFACAHMAQEDRLDLSRLDSAAQKELRRQLMAPTWKLDSQGRRVVEPKDETKKRLGRSPDDADALNLAYAAFHTGLAATAADVRPRSAQTGASDKQRTAHFLLGALQGSRF